MNSCFRFKPRNGADGRGKKSEALFTARLLWGRTQKLLEASARITSFTIRVAPFDRRCRMYCASALPAALKPTGKPDTCSHPGGGVLIKFMARPRRSSRATARVASRATQITLACQQMEDAIPTMVDYRRLKEFPKNPQGSESLFRLCSSEFRRVLPDNQYEWEPRRKPPEVNEKAVRRRETANQLADSGFPLC